MFFQVPSTGEEESLMVVQSYDDLSRKLWQLEGLPLSITAVQGAHPALRYTQVKPMFFLLETSHMNTVIINRYKLVCTLATLQLKELIL